MFINSLKIRLQFKFPEKCGTINKNEAHVRLTTSMWYASNALMKLSGIGILIVTTTALLTFIFGETNLGLVLYPLALNISIFYFSRQAISNSEGFLHYQRVREILYVLETAKAAIYDGKDFDLEPFN